MRPGSFDPQPTLNKGNLTLRPLAEGDREGLYAAAKDPEIWAGHPASNRHERAVFDPYFDKLLGSGTTLAILEGSEIIGCSRYYNAPDTPDTISIGFTFLHRSHWGGAKNFEVKRLMLDHAFAHGDAVLFHIAPANIRSQKATAKLGAVHAYDAPLDLSDGPMPCMCFRLTKSAWVTASETRNG